MLPSFSSTPYTSPSLLSPNFPSCLYHSLYHSLSLSLPLPSLFPCLHHSLYHSLFPPSLHVFITLFITSFSLPLSMSSSLSVSLTFSIYFPSSLTLLLILSLSSCHPPYYLPSISHHPLFIFSRFLPVSITINHNNNISQLKYI